MSLSLPLKLFFKILTKARIGNRSTRRIITICKVPIASNVMANMLGFSIKLKKIVN